jgi:hypothetical protein
MSYFDDDYAKGAFGGSIGTMSAPSQKRTFIGTVDAPNQTFGWLRTGCSPLGGGMVVRFP